MTVNLTKSMLTLAKATTADDAQAVYEHAKGALANTLAPYQNDPYMARVLGIYSQQQDVELQHVVNVKKADLITRGDHAAIDTLYDTSTRQAINTKVGGGNTAPIESAFGLKVDNSVHVVGSMTPEEGELLKNKWKLDVQKGVLEAGIENPNPSIRQQTIDQLRTGKGPLDLSLLDQGEINKFLDHAQEVNSRITRQQEVQNFNGTYNNLHQVFRQAPYVDGQGTPNYSTQRAALDDDGFLMRNGIVTQDANGKVVPNYVMAKQLRAELKSEEADYSDEAKKSADKYRDEIETEFAVNHIAKGLALARQHLPDFEKAKVDYYPQIVNQAKSWTEFQISEARAARAEHTAEQAQERQDIIDRGYTTMGQLQQRFLSGETLDYDRDIFPNVVNKQMNPQQASEVWQAIERSEKDPDFNAGMTIIGNSSLDLATKAKVQGDYSKQFRQENLKGNAAIDRAQKLVDQAGQHTTRNLIMNLYNVLTGGVVIPPTTAPTTQVTPARPKGVPDNAVWNPATKTWQLPQ